jgi:NAD dependent epimerase/dehydratase family enzyme
VRQLEADGHTVIRLVRARPKTPNEVQWAPSSGQFESRVLETVDAVINLSGASTGRIPWTPKYRKEILDSRVDATSTLARSIKAATHPPTVFLSGSAVGFYGDRPGEVLDEQSHKGAGFFPDVVGAWRPRPCRKARA